MPIFILGFTKVCFYTLFANSVTRWVFLCCKIISKITKTVQIFHNFFYNQKNEDFTLFWLIEKKLIVGQNSRKAYEKKQTLNKCTHFYEFLRLLFRSHFYSSTGTTVLDWVYTGGNSTRAKKTQLVLKKNNVWFPFDSRSIPVRFSLEICLRYGRSTLLEKCEH